MPGKTLNMKIEIDFSLVADGIGTQLRKQGFKYDIHEINHCNEDKKSIDRLLVRNLITLNQANVLRNRLFKEIKSKIKTN